MYLNESSTELLLWLKLSTHTIKLLTYLVSCWYVFILGWNWRLHSSEDREEQYEKGASVLCLLSLISKQEVYLYRT